MPTRKLILASHPLPLDEIRIGGLITDLCHPNQDVMTGRIEAVVLDKDCSISIQDNPNDSLSNSVNTSIWAIISRLLSLSFSGSSSATSSITADQSILYELRNPQERFQRLIDDEEVRDWIQEQAENDSIVYMITATQTAKNQRVVQAHEHKNALTYAGSEDLDSVLGESGSTSIKIGGDVSRKGRTTNGFTTPGERVFAFSVRRVVVRSIEESEYKLDKTNQWKMVADNRGAIIDDIIDYVEVVLDDVDARPYGLSQEWDLGNTGVFYLPKSDL